MVASILALRRVIGSTYMTNLSSLRRGCQHVIPRLALGRATHSLDDGGLQVEKIKQ
jgi:hypothetical protein